tara:strand:- start:91 stop:303 length:213 start_codon:yes stop_codon:yes gene_type:complete
MKYKVHVSKGWLQVEWNDNVIIEAEDKDAAKDIAYEMAESGEIRWEQCSDDDSDANYQIEDIMELPDESK